MRRPPASIAAVALLGVWLLAGCGGGGDSGGTTARGAKTARAPRAAPTRTRSHRRHRPPPPRCKDRDLTVWQQGLDGGALLHHFEDLMVSNLGSRACSISGRPKVVAVAANGKRIGGPAGRRFFGVERGPKTVTIPPNGSAGFAVSWSAVPGSHSACRPRTIAGFRVTLPGSRRTRGVPYVYRGRCTDAGTDRSFEVSRIERPSPARRGPLRSPRVVTLRPGERLPRCPSSKLLVLTGPDYAGGAAAGTGYIHLDVANLSGRTCSLSGIPRAVAVDVDGKPVGEPLERSPGMVGIDPGRHVPVAKLTERGSATFTVAIGEPYNYGRSACDFRRAAALRVTLPGSSRPQTVPMPLRRCTVPVPGSQMSIGRIE